MDKKEYIERDAVIDEIESLSVTVTGLRAGKNLLTRYAKHYKDSVVKVLSDIPAEDVVPCAAGNGGEDERSADDGVHRDGTGIRRTGRRI